MVRLPRFALSAFLTACVLATGPVAQWTNPGNPPAERPGAGRQWKLVPATPFSWEDGPNSLGPVNIPFGPAGGWLYLPGLGMQIRLVPSWSSDPTLEVILWPPNSGLPNKPERFLMQFPLHPSPDPADKALVIGFHQYSVSEKNVFNGTSLPLLCAQRGYVLLAPFGLFDTNFGNADSQTALRAILALVSQYVSFNSQRIYTVGFSMGGLNAVSFAMRHQDPGEWRVAGVIDHTGTMDLVQEYNVSDAAGKAVLADADHFGGSPAQVPYNYDRVSPFRMVANAVDQNQARVANLLHIPFYLHANLDDPKQQLLVTETQALHAYLLGKGANATLDLVHGGPVHNWSTLNMTAALDWIEQFSLPPHPANLDEYADRADAYLYTEVRALTAQKVARYQVSASAPSNSFSASGTRDIDTLAFDLPAMGLNSAQALYMDTSSADATSDVYVLKGYAQAPSQVLLFGLFPPQSWSYDALLQEVSITPNSTGSFAQISVIP